MFDLGMQELIVIFIVALLVFGPRRLPELGRTLGKGIAELKRAMHGIKEQVDAELREVKPAISVEDDILKKIYNVNEKKENGSSDLPDVDIKQNVDEKKDSDAG